MAVALAIIVIALSTGTDEQTSASAVLRHQILHLDQEIAEAQREGRQSGGIAIPLPSPFRAESAIGYLELFPATEEQRESLKKEFIRFQLDYLAVQRRFIPELWESAAVRARESDAEQVRPTQERYKLLQRFDQQSYVLEVSLMGEWREILQGSNHFDAALFRFVQYDRLRKRYSIWSHFALPEARPDLFELTNRFTSAEGITDALVSVLQRYVAERGQLVQHRFREKIRMTPKSVGLIALHADGELPWDDFIAQRSRLRRSIVNIDSQLERVNRATLVTLERELDVALFEDVQGEYSRMSYPELFPDQVDVEFRRNVRHWLKTHAHENTLIQVVAAVLDDYERWYDDRVHRLTRMVSRAHREFYLHLTFNALEANDREQAISAFESERDERIERVMTLLNELAVRLLEP
jgi:hypothetical protein